MWEVPASETHDYQKSAALPWLKTVEPTPELWWLPMRSATCLVLSMMETHLHLTCAVPLVLKLAPGEMAT